MGLSLMIQGSQLVLLLLESADEVFIIYEFKIIIVQYIVYAICIYSCAFVVCPTANSGKLAQVNLVLVRQS